MIPKKPAVLVLTDGQQIREAPDTTLEMGTSAITLYRTLRRTVTQLPNVLQRVTRKYPKPKYEYSKIPLKTIPWDMIRYIDWGYDIPTVAKKDTPVNKPAASTRPAGAGGV